MNDNLTLDGLAREALSMESLSNKLAFVADVLLAEGAHHERVSSRRAAAAALKDAAEKLKLICVSDRESV